MNNRSKIKEVIDPIIYQIVYVYLFLRANDSGELLIPVRAISSRFGVSDGFTASVLAELKNRGYISISRPKELPNGPVTKKATRLIIKILDYKERNNFLQSCYPQTLWELAIDNVLTRKENMV